MCLQGRWAAEIAADYIHREVKRTPFFPGVLFNPRARIRPREGEADNCIMSAPTKRAQKLRDFLNS